MTGGWAPATEWLARLGGVRDAVRQELVARYLEAHLPLAGRPLRILDAGCGQGTHLLRLAAAGHELVGLDVDPTMLDALRAALAAAPRDVAARVTVVAGRAEDVAALPDVADAAPFDVIICHGVVMYAPDPTPIVAALAGVLAQGGVLSVLARNQAGIAMRAAHRGRWDEALAAVRGAPAYTNELGAAARGDRVEDLLALLSDIGLVPVAWYGVRALTDTAFLDDNPPAAAYADLEALLGAEEAAGRTDPYRAVAPLVQVIARRPA